ncbi:MAG: DUF1674 domain-containing protein [Rhizobiaceae bacterium]|nr:DUF1674 domain-containing protein [Rhizobiaceae bacterium]
MSTSQEQSEAKPDTENKTLPEAAKRALAEAEARRRGYAEAEAARPREIGGRGGKEPVRYGDWEVKGLASDF